jgi:hypothetical protein
MMKISINMHPYLISVVADLLSITFDSFSQEVNNDKISDKPFFNDPVVDRATDPTVICDRNKPVLINLKPPRKN